MRGRATLISVLAILLVLSASSSGWARVKKPAPDNDLGVTRDEDGTPIIMQGFRMPRNSAAARKPEQPDRRDGQPRRAARGSSTYIPPPVPSPSGGPPASALLNPPPATPPPPPLNTFSDRVTNCLHSFPLNGGVGNNPAGQNAYVRSCAN